MFSRINWYIVKIFLSTWLIINVVISILAVTFDIAERMEDFLNTKPPLFSIITDYYLNFLIYYLVLLSNVIMFLVCLFFTVRMEVRNELLAIMSMGKSRMAIFLPYLIVSLFIGGCFAYLSNYVIPLATRKRVDFEWMYIRGRHHLHSVNVHLKPSPHEYTYFASYTSLENTGAGMVHTAWEGNKMVLRIDARFITWDSLLNKWHLEDVWMRRIVKDRIRISYRRRMDTTFSFTPSTIGFYIFDIEWLPSDVLSEFIRRRLSEGDPNVPLYKLTLYQRTVNPLSVPVFAFVSFLLGSLSTRRQKGLNIVAGLFAVLFYIFLMRVFSVYVTNAGMHPLPALIIPSMLFAITGLVLFAILNR